MLSAYYIIDSMFSVKIDLSRFGEPVFLLICIFTLSVIYCFGLFAYAYGWRLILKFTSNSEIEYHNAYVVFVKSNIAKYIPGNVANYVSRNIIGSRLGWQHKDIVISSIIEIILVVFTSFMISIVLGFEYEKKYLLELLNGKAIIYILCIVIIVLIIFAVFVYRKKFSITDFISKLSLKKLCILSVKAFLAFGLTFIIFGISYVLLLLYIAKADMSILQICNIIGMYMVSWAIGYLTPGAPGGLGVRESILISSLSPMFGLEVIVITSILHRIICIIGDIISLILGYLVEKRIKKESY